MAGDERDALRQVLEEKCPDAIGILKDDDIMKLVAAGFSTAAVLAAATEKDLFGVLPGRPGVVAALLKAFVQPAGKPPLYKSNSSLEASEALRQVLEGKSSDERFTDDEIYKRGGNPVSSPEVQVQTIDQDYRQKEWREELDDKVQDHIRAKGQEIRGLREEIRANEEEIRGLREEIRANEEEIRGVEKEIRANEEEIRGVEKEIVIASGTEVRKLLEAKLQFLRQEISSLRQEISSRDQQISSRDQQISSRDQQISSRDQQIVSLQQGISSVRSVQEVLASAGDLSSVIVRAVETFTPVIDGMKSMLPVFDGMKSMLLERLSATRAASRINSGDLGTLRTALGILGPTPECADSSSTHPLATLLGNDSAGAETFCDDRYEVQQEEQYIKVLKACIPENANRARKLEWKSATGKTLRRTFKGVEFPVSASNDVVLCVRRYSAMFELGALLGVELKKKLTWQGLRQAEVEFYMWSEQSIFPYVQLITDMEHGGVAIYCSSGRDVRILTLESMEGVRRFLKEFRDSLPLDLGQDDRTSKRLVCPDSLSGPARKKFKSSDLGVNSTGQQQDTSQTAGQVALWSMVARWKNNLHDVGNMRDFDDFGDLGDFGDDVLVHG